MFKLSTLENGFIGAGEEIRTPDQRLGNTHRGIAQTLVKTGNSPPHLHNRFLDSLPDFASLCLNSHPFVCIFNTYVTPDRTSVFRSHNPRKSPLHKSRSPQLFRWSASGGCGLRIGEAHNFRRGELLSYFPCFFFSCLLAFCFLLLSLSFFPPLSPMVYLLLV